MQHDFILLDRSGSMSSMWSEAISSINAYVKKLAEENVDTGVTLACFDSEHGKVCFDIMRDRITPATWRPVTAFEAPPRGTTPLNDATGKIVALAEAGNYDKVAIIIMTDGAENASRELTVDQAKAALQRCRDRGWQVVFLGANFDNAVQARSYGNLAASSASLAAGKMGDGMNTMAMARSAYSTSGKAMEFTDAEKANLAKPSA